MAFNKEILKVCMKQGFLLDKNILDSLSLIDEVFAKKFLFSFSKLNIFKNVINKEVISDNLNELQKIFLLEEEKILFNNFVSSLGIFIKEPKDNLNIKEKKEIKGVKILFSPIITPKKISVDIFVSNFRARYEQLKRIISEKNLSNLKSLRRIGRESESFNIIVCVYDKKVTKNGNIILDVEDLYGKAKVLINSNRKEVFEDAKNILLDQVIAIEVSGNNEILFANNITFPDARISEKKRSKNEEIVAFISDLHIGSSMFFEENFNNFINWLNLEGENSDQIELAKKIKYLMIVGDSVDGVGIFPDQEKFLNINDMYDQYKKLAELLSKIRKDIQIIICPGQHDAVWVGEPQPPIDEKWAPDLFKLENVTLVSNPTMVRIAESFDILMYHGAGMHGIIEFIEEIRTKYGHKFPTRVTKEMLRGRHLIPMHGSCDYIPNEKKDLMVIESVPDIICTGDQHRPEVSSYNGIILIASSCWQKKTPFEEKVGHEPDPCKVPIFNLKTREVKILDFSS
jgi:DNA polymerase II small subunit